MLARRRRRLASTALLTPALVIVALLFVIPLGRIGFQSVQLPSVGLDNYRDLFTDGYTFTVLCRTLLSCAIVALVSGLLGYPYAYAMTVASPRQRAVLMTIVLIPFWTSALARNYAWYVLFQDGGLFQRAATWFGIDNFVLLGTTTAVTIAMTFTLLPFLILPLYTNMDQIDRRLLLAARTLGASRIEAFLRVYLPLSLPGLISGLSLVFVLGLGFYVAPALLGSPQNAFVAQLIVIKLNSLGDFGGAGALGIFILAVTILILTVGNRVAGLGVRALGASSMGTTNAREGKE